MLNQNEIEESILDLQNVSDLFYAKWASRLAEDMELRVVHSNQAVISEALVLLLKSIECNQDPC